MDGANNQEVVVKPAVNPAIDKIRKSIDAIGGIDLAGVRLEDADVSLLNIESFNLDMHVAMQPAALAFYGKLKCDAERRLLDVKRRRDRWSKESYAKAKTACLAESAKATVADIEAKAVVLFAEENAAWDAEENAAQDDYDTLSAWYEAWRQKGYAIREHVSMEIGERCNSNPSYDPVNNVKAPPPRLMKTGFDIGDADLPPGIDLGDTSHTSTFNRLKTAVSGD